MAHGRERPTDKPQAPDPLDPLARPRYEWMCSAHARDGSGRCCRQRRKMGQNVCGSHGGNTPIALQKAQERIDKMALAMVDVLVEIALDAAAVEPKDRIAAAKEMLNRTREVLQPTQELKHSGGVEHTASPEFVALVTAARERLEQETSSGTRRKSASRKALESAIDAEVIE